MLVLALGPLVVTGCQPRLKSLESYQSATTVNPNPMPGKGDKDSFGGIASASGGRVAITSYATNVKGNPKVVTAPVTGK